MRRVLHCVFLASALLTFSTFSTFTTAVAFAQVDRATLSGLITDSNGGVLPGATVVVSHLGNVAMPLGDDPLYLRITRVGGFKMTGQAHHSIRTWEWDSTQVSGWRERPPPCGVSPVIYDLARILGVE